MTQMNRQMTCLTHRIAYSMRQAGQIKRGLPRIRSILPLIKRGLTADGFNQTFQFGRHRLIKLYPFERLRMREG